MYIEKEKLEMINALRKTKLEEVEQWYTQQLFGINVTKDTYMIFQAEKEHKFEQIAELTKVGYFELRSKSRKRELVAYRHIMSYLGNKRLGMSTLLLGQKLCRDHSSVISAIRKVNDWKQFQAQHEGEMVIYNEINNIFDRIIGGK